MDCKQCNTPIEQTGNKPKIFCSDKCRMAYNRTLSEQTQFLSEQVLSEQGLSEQTQDVLSEQLYPRGKDCYSPIHDHKARQTVFTLSDGQTFNRDYSAQDRLSQWAITGNKEQQQASEINRQYQVISDIQKTCRVG